MASSTGSYTIYSGSAAVNIALQSAAAKDVAATQVLSEPVVHEAIKGDSSLVSFITDLGLESLVVEGGHVYLDGISITDISTTVLVIITALATLIRAYYDFKDWNDKRRINKMIMQRAEVVKEEEMDKKEEST